MTILCKNVLKTLFTAGENVNLHDNYGHQSTDSHRELGEEREKDREETENEVTQQVFLLAVQTQQPDFEPRTQGLLISDLHTLVIVCLYFP